MLKKIYCFTTSYSRPYHLYNTINNILNQSYNNITYCININIDHESEEILFNDLISDLIDDRLKIMYSYNEQQHINYIKALSLCEDDDNAIYIKIDDDDIYHKQYIKYVIDTFTNNSIDILSSNIYRTINNDQIIKKKMTSIGSWSGDDHPIRFGFPTTYAFNLNGKKAIDKITNQEYKTIHPFEDAVWRTIWRRSDLKSLVVDNDHFTYHIHKKNTSSSHLLNKDPISTHQPYIDNEHCIISQFHHKLWQSYIFLNKRNNRCYHINNDDHGSFTMTNDTITIVWENYNTKEVFIKNKEDGVIYKQL